MNDAHIRHSRQKKNRQVQLDPFPVKKKSNYFPHFFSPNKGLVGSTIFPTLSALTILTTWHLQGPHLPRTRAGCLRKTLLLEYMTCGDGSGSGTAYLLRVVYHLWKLSVEDTLAERCFLKPSDAVMKIHVVSRYDIIRKGVVSTSHIIYLQ